MKTGEWVRRAARGEGVVITERGRPVASLIPFREGDAGRSFRERHVLPEFDARPGQMLARPYRLESGLERLCIVLPVKCVELPPREPDERIPGTQRVVQEGEGMVLR